MLVFLDASVLVAAARSPSGGHPWFWKSAGESGFGLP
jgi:hypothetical protein